MASIFSSPSAWTGIRSGCPCWSVSASRARPFRGRAKVAADFQKRQSDALSWRLVAPILFHRLSTVAGMRARSKFQARADVCHQNRSIPNMKSNATVTAPDSSNDPTQPNRFEKKKNTILPAFHHLPGRSTTLITPSSLSRNFLYIAGASSRLAGCVTTKLGSISPASILCKSGLV
jgi:hypothetical protein